MTRDRLIKYLNIASNRLQLKPANILELYTVSKASILHISMHREISFFGPGFYKFTENYSGIRKLLSFSFGSGQDKVRAIQASPRVKGYLQSCAGLAGRVSFIP